MKRLIILLFFFLNSNVYGGDGHLPICGTFHNTTEINNMSCGSRYTYRKPVKHIIRGYIKVHYVLGEVPGGGEPTTGEPPTDSDGTTEMYAHTIAELFKHHWEKQCNELGWEYPPNDGNCGGDDRYDIYIRGGLPAYGRTVREARTDNMGQNEYTSFIEISNQIPNHLIHRVVAHEFNHACQFSYGLEDSWWHENTAAWMEHVSCNNIQFLLDYFDESKFKTPDPLDSPHLSIDSDVGLYVYAGCLWLKFLQEFYKDNSIIRKLWAHMGSTFDRNTLNDINYVLRRNPYYSNLNIALENYALWRYYTGSRADGRHFSFASQLPNSKVLVIHSNYPVNGPTNDNNNLCGPGATNYIHFVYEKGNLNVTFDGKDRNKWKAYLIGFRKNLPSEEIEISLNQSGYGSSTISFNNVDTISLVPIWLEYSPTIVGNYIYHADLERVQIQFANRIGYENAGGSLLLNDIDIIESESIRFLIKDSYNKIQTNHERFARYSEVCKHNNWNSYKMKNKLFNYFVADNSGSQIAYFENIIPVKVYNELIGAINYDGGKVYFRDPWRL